MRRNYLYIIIILLTIIAFVSYYYFDQSLEAAEINSLEVAKNLEPNIFDEEKFEDIFDSAAMKSPLIITNYQNDDEIVNYTYNLKIDGIFGAYKYKKNDKEGYIVFSANGEATIKLDSNESITIYDVPNEIEYFIEQVTNVSDKYTTKINDVTGTSGVGIVSLETHITIENNTIIEYPKKDEEKPIIVEKNPVTGDNFYYILIIFTTMIGMLFTLSKIKVKRFE